MRKLPFVNPGMRNVYSSLSKAVQVVLRTVVAGEGTRKTQTKRYTKRVWGNGRVGSETQSPGTPGAGSGPLRAHQHGQLDPLLGAGFRLGHLTCCHQANGINTDSRKQPTANLYFVRVYQDHPLPVNNTQGRRSIRVDGKNSTLSQ